MVPMNAAEIIEKKRDGSSLSTEEIEWFVRCYTAGDLPDYQAAALLMAIYFQGMDRRETVDLTLAMAHSGDQLDIHRAVGYALDKHSSGGVGDKTTLVVLPLVVACGHPVGKMSGRALGFSGGTLDKMESIPGWRAELSVDQFLDQLREHHIVLCGQTGDLAPADRQLYALRDVTATVSAPALIASSIMSKKLAAGADGIVLDVKVGRGAFVATLDKARRLATLMAQVGADAGRQVVALISDMNQPLGQAVGNAVEVREAIATLHGGGPSDLRHHCLEVAAQMVALADGSGDVEAAHELCQARLDDGAAWEQFRVLVRVQGGDVSAVDDPSRLPTAPVIETVTAPQSGSIAVVDAEVVGRTAMALGAGRERKDDLIDHAVGCEVLVNVGDKVSEGDRVFRIHANDDRQVAEAREKLLGALGWSDEPVDPLPLFYDRIAAG
jgi:pyrimidine-nucleoside phosphorylase